MTRFLLVLWFLLFSIRVRTLPWRFFQLNAPYFNLEKGIFSKLDIDKTIPEKWRPVQCKLCCQNVPKSFPVFVKPEWGQNSRGIIRVDSPGQFQETCLEFSESTIDYIVQNAASGRREFEVFYIRSASNLEKCSFMSVTEVKNICSSDPLPVNGIYNHCTTYHDCTSALKTEGQKHLWEIVKKIGVFRIARVGFRADSLDSLLNGMFQIFEINLFLPMPLSLLDKSKSFSEKIGLIKHSMLEAARTVKAIPTDQPRQNIFFRKVAAHYKVKP